MRYVGFWARVLATLIDTVCALIVIVPLVWALFGYRAALALGGVQGAPALALDAATALVIVLFWVGRQATPGKMLIGARIVDATTLAEPTKVQCVIRYLGYFVSSLPLALGFLWIAFDPRKQGWHDKLAHTVVVRAQDASQSRALRKSSPSRASGDAGAGR